MIVYYVIKSLEFSVFVQIVWKLTSRVKRISSYKNVFTVKNQTDCTERILSSVYFKVYISTTNKKEKKTRMLNT